MGSIDILQDDDMIRTIAEFTQFPSEVMKYESEGKIVYRQWTVQPLRGVNKRSVQVLEAPRKLGVELDDSFLQPLSEDLEERERMVNGIAFTFINSLPPTPCLDDIHFEVFKYWGKVHIQMAFTVNNLQTTGGFSVSALTHFLECGLSFKYPHVTHTCDDFRSLSFECAPGALMNELVENILQICVIVTA